MLKDKYDIEHDIIQPLDCYLKGEISEKDIKWWDWKWAIRHTRKESSSRFYEVRSALQPYYVRYIMGDKDFFRNGNTDTNARNALREILEEEGQYAGRLFNSIDIVTCAENWSERLMPDNHDPGFFFMLMKTIVTRDYSPNWNLIYDNLKKKLARANNFGNFKTHEMYCLLMGLTMIERTDLPREKKNELFALMHRHWQFIKYMYSVLIHYIVGLKVENFAAVANSVCKKSSYPFMHWFYKAFNENFDILCPEGLIDTHSGKSVREQALVHRNKMENIIKSTKPSNELDELFSILFPKVIKDVLKQSRPKTYEELEADIDDLSNRYHKVLEQLTNAVKDVETDKITAEDLTAAFLRFPIDLALSFFGSVSTLLALNPTWQKCAPQIQHNILAKQQHAQFRQEQRQEKMMEQVKSIADKPSVVIDSVQDVIADGGKKIVQNIITDKKE